GADDGEPGTAVGARYEGVAVTTVAWVEQLGDAVVADGDIGRDRGSGSGDRLAFHDTKPAAAQPISVDINDVDSTDRPQWRRIRAQPPAEFVDECARSLHFEEDRARIVADESGQPKFGGDPVDERTESHALNDTGHGEPSPDAIDLHQRVSHRRGHGPSAPDRSSPARRRPDRSSRRR